MTHEIPTIRYNPLAGRLLGSWHLKVLGAGALVSTVALWAALSTPGSNTPAIEPQNVAALAPVTETFDEFASFLEPREPIPVAPARTVPAFGSPGEPNSGIDSGSVAVDIVPHNGSTEADSEVSGLLHPTPSWVNAFSPNSTFNGNPIAVGDIVTAYDEQGVLMGRSEVGIEGKYGLMALYMDDPSTAMDEGASPGETITFKVNGIEARVAGPNTPVWSSNGAILMLNLETTS